MKCTKYLQKSQKFNFLTKNYEKNTWYFDVEVAKAHAKKSWGETPGISTWRVRISDRFINQAINTSPLLHKQKEIPKKYFFLLARLLSWGELCRLLWSRSFGVSLYLSLPWKNVRFVSIFNTRAKNIALKMPKTYIQRAYRAKHLCQNGNYKTFVQWF